MKISWGFGITVTIIIFLVSTIGLVYFTSTVDVNLVADNYYQKELDYQQKIDKINRANNLPEHLKIKASAGIIEFVFPKIFSLDKIGGTIDLYYPADKKMDAKYEIQLKNGYRLLLPTNNLKKGYWKVEVNWNSSDTLYFTEKRLMIK